MKRWLYSVYGLIVGAVVAALTVVFFFPAVDPSVWDEFAGATGLRNDGAFAPVLWRCFVGAGISLKVMGAATAGLFAFALYDLLWRVIRILICPTDEMPRAWKLTIPLFALFGSLLAVFADPVWRLALTGAPALLELALFVLAIDCFLVQYFSSPIWSFVAFFLAGALAIETPAALVLPMGFVALHWVMNIHAEDGRYESGPSELRLRIFPDFPSWLSFLTWSLGFIVLYAWAAFGAGEISFLRLLGTMYRSIGGAANFFGWMLWIGFCLLPFVIAIGVLPVLTGEDRLLEFFPGVVTLLSGIIAYGQVSPFAATRFWCFLGEVQTVVSPFMLGIGAMLSAVAVMFSVLLFAFFAFHRMPENYEGKKPLALAIGIICSLMAMGIVTTVPRGNARELREFIAEAVDETVRECAGCKWVFTDGCMDAGIELAAAKRNQLLKALPMIERSRVWRRNLDALGLNEVDRESVEKGAAVLLRDWAAHSASNLEVSAVQLGFELWRREQKSIPPIAALVARPGGIATNELVRARAMGEKLEERALELAESHRIGDESDAWVRRVFSSILWRLSRMARAQGEIDRADRLDEANLILKHMLDAARRERSAAFLQMTDEEGLKLALKRADFIEARRFASGVLKRDPKSVPANFGMGMSYLLENRLNDALTYLKTANEGAPNEPAILNNLAILYMKKNLLDEALKCALKASELAPEVPEVKETLKRVQRQKKFESLR